MFLLDSIPNASDQPVSSPTVSDRTDPIRVVLPQLISYVFDLTIWVRRSTRLYSLYLSTRRSNKISSYEERNQRLWINSGLFTNLNVTCAMQVMLVLHAAICICICTNLNVACAVQVMLVLHAAICICTNVFKNTETRLHLLANIFATSILWPQGIVRRIFVFKEVYEQIWPPSLWNVVLFKNWDLLSMCSRTQFVQGF